MRSHRMTWIVAAAVAAGTVPMTAAADDRWSPARYLEPPMLAREYPMDAALNTRGDAVVVERMWMGSTGRQGIVVRQRTGRRGAWSASRRIVPRTFPSDEGLFAAVRVNDAGDAVVAFNDGKSTSVVVRRDPSGRWGAPQRVAVNELDGFVLDGEGNAEIVQAVPDRCPTMELGRDCHMSVMVRRSTRDAPAFVTAPAGLVVTPNWFPSWASNRAGDIVGAWTEVRPDGSEMMMASRRLAGEATFEPPRDIGPPGAARPAAAIGDGGDAVIMWGAGPPPAAFERGTPHRIEMMRRSRDGEWVALPVAAQLDAPRDGRLIEIGQLAVDRTGAVTVSWGDGRMGIPGSDAEYVGVLPEGATAWQRSPNLLRSLVLTEPTGTTPFLAFENGRVLVAGGHRINRRVSWTWESRLGWRERILGAADAQPVMASAADGTALHVERGFGVRNLDAAATPPAPTVRIRRVAVRGGSVIVTLQTTRPGRLYVAVRPTTWMNTSGGHVLTGMRRAGVHTLRVDDLGRGAYLLNTGVCEARRGCSVSPARTVGIRTGTARTLAARPVG